MKENGVTLLVYPNSDFGFLVDILNELRFFANSILALRKAEKEEEKRAREKIRQKLEEDKVLVILLIIWCLLFSICWNYPIVCNFSLDIWTSVPLDDWVCCIAVVCSRCLGVGHGFPIIFFSYCYFFRLYHWVELWVKTCLCFQAERRRKLGLPPEEPGAAKPSAPPVEEKKVFSYLILHWYVIFMI